MVTLMLDSAHVEVVLSATEKAMSFRKKNVIINRAEITRVQLTDDAWTWLRGVADPGIYLPVALAAGSWKSAGARDFVLLRRRRPSVIIELEGHDEFQRLIFSTSHGVSLVKSLRLDAGVEPIDVVDLAPGHTKAAQKTKSVQKTKPAQKKKPTHKAKSIAKPQKTSEPDAQAEPAPQAESSSDSASDAS